MPSETRHRHDRLEGCPDCGQQGVDGVCKACGTNTDLLEIVRDHQFDMEAMWLEAKDAVMQTSDLPVKGDTYLGSGEKHPEPLRRASCERATTPAHSVTAQSDSTWWTSP